MKLYGILFVIFRPVIEKRSISPSRKTREKLKAVDSDLETEIEEVSLIVKLGQLT